MTNDPATLKEQLRVAEAYRATGKVDDAKAILDQLRHAADATPEARLLVAEAYARMGRSAEAEMILRQLRQAPHGTPQLKILVAEAYHRMGRQAPAEMILNELRYGVNAPVEVKILVAEAYYRMGRAAEARAMLDLLRYDTNATIRSRIRVAEAFDRMGSSNEMQAIFDELRFDPDASVETKVLVAQAFGGMGRSSEAQAILDELRLDPDASVATKVLVAQAFEGMGRSDEAQAILDELRFDPDASVETKVVVAQAFEDMGRSDEAQAILDELRFDPDASVATKVLVAQALERKGRSEEAHLILQELRDNTISTSSPDIVSDDHVARPQREEPAFRNNTTSESNYDKEQTQPANKQVAEAATVISDLSQPSPKGRAFSFQRTAADDELCLGVQKYAKVLARLFRLPDPDDFCIAIFGFWGRGKTFLLEQTAKIINTGVTADSERYETVFFSAWKYPSRPEVWIHLYETFFQKLRKAGWWKSLAYVIRAGIARHGKTRLVFIWGALMFSAFPKGWLITGIEDYFRSLEWSVAIGAVIFCLIFGWKLWKTTFVLEHGFLKAPRHSEKLGLQATIGKDLSALLKGWVAVDKGDRSVRRGWAMFWLLVIMLVATIEWRAGTAWQVGVFFSSVLLASACTVALAFEQAVPSPRRVLLVVDDLDRCPFEHLLTVVESIKLLIEDKEISRRLQLAVLVEEDVLQHAIWNKYQKLAEADAAKALGTGYTAARIVRENCEKLFTAHLRLGPLSARDVSDMVTTFARLQAGKRPESQNLSDPPISSKANSAGERVQRKVKSDELDISTAGIVPKEPILPTFADEVLGDDEKRAIRDELQEMRGRSLGDLGPRAIRSFMFRYQLARLILDELNTPHWEPAVLVQLLAAKSLWGQEIPLPGEPSNPYLFAVVNQVG
jgi:thioredoxin-like negative regulator of GroEL